jgi:hypothetical protein
VIGASKAAKALRALRPLIIGEDMTRVARYAAEVGGKASGMGHQGPKYGDDQAG